MADQIVITEKSSQAKDVRAAVGSRYGDVLAAEGHLLDLLEPEDVVPAWKRWSPILLRPEGLYGTRPAEGGNKAAKLRAIREALRTAKRVWLATDCDREGQLIGQEILEHYEYHGQVMRVLFTAQDSQTIRDADLVGHNRLVSKESIWQRGLRTYSERIRHTSCAVLGVTPPRDRSCLRTSTQPGRAGVVEHNLAKVGVVGSNPIARSKHLNDLAAFRLTETEA